MNTFYKIVSYFIAVGAITFLGTFITYELYYPQGSLDALIWDILGGVVSFVIAIPISIALVSKMFRSGNTTTIRNSDKALVWGFLLLFLILILTFYVKIS